MHPWYDLSVYKTRAKTPPFGYFALHFQSWNRSAYNRLWNCNFSFRRVYLNLVSSFHIPTSQSKWISPPLTSFLLPLLSYPWVPTTTLSQLNLPFWDSRYSAYPFQLSLSKYCWFVIVGTVFVFLSFPMVWKEMIHRERERERVTISWYSCCKTWHT